MSDRIARARDFIYRNARLLERRRFAHLFEGAPRAGVIAALAAYQHADGGFGDALEPDKRTPHPQPQDCEIAFHILDECAGFNDAAQLVARACDWLNSVTTEEGGVPYTLATVDAFPHTPWWGSEGRPPVANINPTAAIVGLLDKHGVKHAWIEPAAEFCWREIEGREIAEYHDVMPALEFLAHAYDRPRSERQIARIAERIGQPGAVEFDANAKGYVKKPLDWAPAPDAPLRKLFTDDVLRTHLAALAAQQQDDGGWPISWESTGPGATLEWRGMATIGALKTLRAYGAL